MTPLAKLKVIRQRFEGIRPEMTAKGICISAGLMLHTDDTYWKSLVETWGEFSGSFVYPVRHPAGLPPAKAYAEEALWKGDYGAARRRLLHHILAQLALDHKFWTILGRRSGQLEALGSTEELKQRCVYWAVRGVTRRGLEKHWEHFYDNCL